MKQTMILLLAMLAMVFSSCSDDDENTSFSLDGTTWVADEGTIEVLTLKFSKSTFNFTLVYDENTDGIPEDTYETSGSYAVDGKNIVLTDSSGEKQYGTIDGNKITFVEDGYSLDYYKK